MGPRAQSAYASARKTSSRLLPSGSPAEAVSSAEVPVATTRPAIAYALGVAELVDGDQQRAAIFRLVSQRAHDLACLPQIEAVKRLVHQQQGERRQQLERQQ